MKKVTIHSTVIPVLLAGVVWGCAELVGGGAIRSAGIPFRAAILTGTGFFIMGFHASSTGNLRWFFAVALAAAVTLHMGVPLYGASLACRANSSLALALHGGALTAVWGFANRRGPAGYSGLALIGFTAAVLSSAVFLPLGLRLVPCAYLLSFSGPEGFYTFLMKEGLAWATVSGVALPLGYRAGMLIREQVRGNGTARGFYYAGSFLTAAISLIAAAVLINPGV